MAKEEAGKPMDASDLTTIEEAKAEVTRLRGLAALQIEAAEAAPAEPSSERRGSKSSVPPAGSRRGSNASTGSAKPRRGSNASVRKTSLPPFEGDSVELEKAVRQCYVGFCQFGAGRTSSGNITMELDGSKFNKLAKECGLVDKKFTSTSVDMIFSKVKPKGQKKISYELFLEALRHMAEQKGAALEQIMHVVAVTGGPKNSGTKAEYNRFFDDKSTYGQGVHANGGPSTNDNAITLSNLTDRDNKADVRGVVNPDNLATK